MKIASKGDRFLNYIIDTFIVVTACLVCSIMMDLTGITLSGSLTFLVYGVIHVSYYQYYEFRKTGITLGKKVTRTRVMDCSAQPPAVSIILARTVLRLFPLDTLSYLFGSEIGIHDWFSGTVLVKKGYIPCES